MQNLKTAPLDDGKVGLLYLYDRISDALNYETEPCCEFVHLDEVLEHGAAAENYSYKLCSQEQIMSFLVSDDRYTRNHLYDLAVAVMHDPKPAPSSRRECLTLKTVQQHLRELDRERLIDAYLYRVRHDILDCYRDEESNNYRRTIREIRRDHEEFIGEYEYTQQNIYELMVDVMYEASWFGFADEGKEDFVDDLQDQIDQLQAGTLETCPVDDIFPD